MIVVLLALWLAPHGAAGAISSSDAVLIPVWMEGGNASFLLGTDPVGRDILSRLIHGTRYSLFIGTITTLALTGGIVNTAGYCRAGSTPSSCA